MKTLTTILTAFLTAIIILGPALVVAQGTITVTTNASSYTTGQDITISGTVTPSESGVATVVVTSPTNVPVYRNAIAVSSGSFSTGPFPAGGSDWPTGTYTVLVALSGYTNGTTTFSYTATGVSSTTSALQLFAQASSVVPLGETAYVSAFALWNNGTAATNVSFTGDIVSPSGSYTAVSAGTPSQLAGSYWWSIPTTSSTPTGLYQVILTGTASGVTVSAFTSYTVADIASNSSLSGISSQLSSLSSSVSSMSSSLSSIQSSLSSMQSTLSGLSTSITSINTQVTNANSSLSKIGGISGQLSAISAAQTSEQTSLSSISSALSSAQTAASSASSSAQAAATAAKNAQNAVSTVSTYVIAVAVLAIITLVLELAILIRKLS
jgi:trimeric autotransporter adhesin